jgi:predicted RNA-binding Zn ribbon-like protein
MAPGESPPAKTAPQPLYLVQRFVNSIDLESGEDELETPEALGGWLSERGLMDARERVSRADLTHAVDVREGLRALLLRNNGLALDEAKVARLDGVAERTGIHVRFDAGDEPALEPAAKGVDGALARLLAIVAESVAGGSWERLKACPREECEWAFFDRSKNRSGRWCRMEQCGNLAKARAFRERRRRGSQAQAHSRS